jgi:hypothetical protein
LQKVTFCNVKGGKRKHEKWRFDVTSCISSAYVCGLKAAMFSPNGVPPLADGLPEASTFSRLRKLNAVAF